MLAHVKVPVLLTHHFHQVDHASGRLLGAVSDDQARIAEDLVRGAGQPFTIESFPNMPHAMHTHDPQRYVATLTRWADALTQ